MQKKKIFAFWPFLFSFVSLLNIFSRFTKSQFIRLPQFTVSPSPVITPTPSPSHFPTPYLSPTFFPTITLIPSPSPTPSLFPIPTEVVTPTPTFIPTSIPTQPSATPTPSHSYSWPLQSVSSMKETKDRVCQPRDENFIEKWVSKAQELGANYISLETPYDNPSCGNSIEYTKKWLEIIRRHGLGVWHRHMPLAFEGIYDKAKSKGDYLGMVVNYIKNHPDFFREGDIFTPIPEPQNGGIAGITYCSNNLCIFESKEHFNRWLREAIDLTEQAFEQIGLGGKIKVGYFGFDGFVAWGSHNPDWQGILEDKTVQKMGNLTIDHYPQLIGQTMEQGLNELMAKYPNVPIIIGEWGSVGESNVEQQVKECMGAAKRPGVVGFNYWHLGMGGNEALINEDFTNRPQFDDVQNFYKGKY